MGKELLVPWLWERSLISWFISSLAKHFSVHCVDLGWWLWGSARQCAARRGEKPSCWWSVHRKKINHYYSCFKTTTSWQTSPRDLLSYLFLKFQKTFSICSWPLWGSKHGLHKFPSNITPPIIWAVSNNIRYLSINIQYARSSSLTPTIAII